jgi:hypothetical protein
VRCVLSRKSICSFSREFMTDVPLKLMPGSQQALSRARSVEVESELSYFLPPAGYRMHEPALPR